MKILLTGSGALACAYVRINPHAQVCSFRNMANEEMDNLVQDADVIIHNAARRYGDDPEQMVESNFFSTRRIVNTVAMMNPSVKFINIGSMSYLSQDGYLPISQMSQYAYSKFLSEVYCFMNLSNVVSVRFSTIFYKDHTRDGLSKLIYTAKKDKEIVLYNHGSARRDYLPIDVAAEYLHYVVTHDCLKVVNICSGYETSFLEIGNFLSEYLGIDVQMKYAMMPHALSKFTRTLPEISFSLYDEIKDYLKCVQ